MMHCCGDSHKTQYPYQHVVASAIAGLKRVCENANIDASHGLEHALTVLCHLNKAVDSSPIMFSPSRVLAMQLAALLHDADDRKYFPQSCDSYANAQAIMEAAGAAAIEMRDDDSERLAVIPAAIGMIKLVSCSANGNSVPPEAVGHPEVLWPRWADRLEATGVIGVVRCFQYNMKAGTPIAVEGTPRPKTAEEAFELATEERFAQYQQSRGDSASMVDHYYDKLLQVARPSPSLVQNPYLEREARSRVDPLLSICLAYSFGGVGGVLECVHGMARMLDVSLPEEDGMLTEKSLEQSKK